MTSNPSKFTANIFHPSEVQKMPSPVAKNGTAIIPRRYFQVHNHPHSHTCEYAYAIRMDAYVCESEHRYSESSPNIILGT